MESETLISTASRWPLKLLETIVDMLCLRHFFQLFLLCPGMLLPIKLLIPIREDCMLQDQNPQESTSLPFFPYQNNFYEAYKLSSNL